VVPSHASASRKGGGEALTGGVQAWLLSSEITSFGLPTLWNGGAGRTKRRVRREWRFGPAESKTQGMYASSMHGNREIPGVTGRNPRSVRSEKAQGRTPGVGGEDVHKIIKRSALELETYNLMVVPDPPKIASCLEHAPWPSTTSTGSGAAVQSRPRLPA